jgi:hypothetical protein
MSTEARKIVGAGSLTVLLVACASQQLVKTGDALLASQQYAEALAAYGAALAEQPGDPLLLERIHQARRAQVGAELAAADVALEGGALALSVGAALRARHTPLSLDDVDLLERVEAAVSRTAAAAEDRVRQLCDEGRFAAAVALSRQIAEAASGARDAWADEVRARGISHYTALAAKLAARNPGSAAVQLALARELGAPIEPAAVASLWRRFTDGFCPAAVQLKVSSSRALPSELVTRLQTDLSSQLEPLRQSCGQGTRPLIVHLQVAKMESKDDSARRHLLAPRDGVTVPLEETVTVDEPITEVEEVTDYEERREPREQRDCAPRPGQERGCRTWTEEVVVKVPVVHERQVQRVRRVERKRPVDLAAVPADQVVAFDVVTTSRRAHVAGRLDVQGATPQPFDVEAVSQDSDHQARPDGSFLPAPRVADVKPLGQLFDELGQAIAKEAARATFAATSAWAAEFAAQAHAALQAGEPAQAEEAYLRALALGETTPDMAGFFDGRYGRAASEVMAALAQAQQESEVGPAPADRDREETGTKAGSRQESARGLNPDTGN